MSAAPQQGAIGGLSAAGAPQHKVIGGLSTAPQQGAIGGLSAAGTPQQEGFSAIGAQHGGSATGILQPHLSTFQAPLVLQNPTEVCNEFTSLSEHNVGKLARELACRSVFGANVLKQSTITGDVKRGLKMLDKKKLLSSAQ